MNKKNILLLLVLGMLTACGPTWSTSNIDKASGEKRAARDPSSITLSESDSSKPYTSLGDISVTVRKTTIFNADPTREGVDGELKEKAAEMGADAVVLVRYGTVGVSAWSWGSLDGKGRAIVYK